VHQHLIVESPDKEVMQVIQRTTADINALWKSVYLPKVILFGVDEKGQHSHACNGPTAKAVLRHKSLLIETIKKMQPVYAMLERGLYSPGQKVQKVKVVGRSAEKGGKGGKKGKKGEGELTKEVKKKHKKIRGVDFGDVCVDPEPETTAAKGGEASSDALNWENVETCELCEVVSGGELPDELRDAERAQTQLTYTQRVGAAFVSYITFYVYLHANHGVKASEVSPTARTTAAEEAVKLSLDMQRAMLALIGTHRRRTYAHDFVYGMHQVYSLFAKPWNASTEGSEHAHQDMKKYFHHLCCHNAKSEHGSCYQVLRLRTVKTQLLKDFASMLLPWSEYAAMRANMVCGDQNATTAERDRKRKHHHATGAVKGEKKYKEGEERMVLNATNINAQIVHA
jgi:hypothetical protein|tara:strand:+ start:545 stop:1735 length:1191 start_codon:yes stop_codon:yes gene_type:complete